MKNSFLLPSLVMAGSVVFFADSARARSYTFEPPTVTIDTKNTKLYQNCGDKVPVVIKMPSGNLLRVSQKGDWIFFDKTSFGYAKSGFQVDLPGIIEAGVDSAEGGIYTSVNNLEVLAYFKNNWFKIYGPVVDQAKIVPNSVEPKYVQMTLERLVTPEPEIPSYNNNQPAPRENVEAWWEQYPSQQKQRTEPYTLKAAADDILNGNSDEESVALYILLDNNDLLRIGQKTTMRDFKKKISFTFHKTSPGYAVGGGKLKILGYGGGIETASGNQYDEISAAEALALVDNNPDRILEAADRQAIVIENSVEPLYLENLFQIMGVVEDYDKQPTPPTQAKTPAERGGR